ncbi:MAG: aminotransferase class I/II-fold pyridoxal phosphate-dependent enzyme [Planctomycetaceae bacterium]
MAVDIMQTAPSGSFPAVAVGCVRGLPGAHGRAAIAEVVLETLEQVRPAGLLPRLATTTVIADAGIDADRFLDAVGVLEGRYEMRFHASWLTGIRTCGDLVERIAEHMFDAADRSEAPGAAAATGAATSLPVAAAANGDPWPECRALEDRFAALDAAGLESPFLIANERVAGRVATIRGRETIAYTSFDYLGLAGHADVKRAAKAAIDIFGCSASASRMVGGNNTVLDDLDAELAAFIGTERAAMFPCGFGTNASVFGHLFGEGDLILYDELAHMSIAQGAALSKAGKRSFRHNDHRQLDGLLRDLRSRYRRVVVAIEGVYSMDGDYPDLPAFLDVKRRHDALLYVDEAHSIGTMGPGGRGICDFFGVDSREGDLWMGTISKALGAQGGYLAGPERLIHYLGHTTPSFVFSTACSPANAAAALEAIRVIGREPWRLARLRERSDLFLKLCHDVGLDTGTSGDTPVIPVILGSSSRAMLVSQRLLEEGINARPILYPAVRESAARVRFFLTCEHTEEQIVRTVETLERIVAETA